MTPLPPPTSPSSPPSHTIRLAEPSDLIAAVPVLLGFRPRDSLVLIALHRTPSGRHRLGLGLRVDLPPPRHAAAVAAQAADGLLLDDPAEAAVIVVGRGPSGRAPGRPQPRPRGAGSRARRRRPSGPPRPEIAGAAIAALRERGIVAHSVMWTQRCAAGSPWACYDGCCSGTLADPGGTAMAAHAVAEGQVVYGERAELEALVTPVARPVLRRREKLLERAFAEVCGQAGPDGAAEGPAEFPGSLAADSAQAAIAQVEAGMRTLDVAVAAAAQGELQLDDDAVVGLALALGLPEVRDEAMRLCTGPQAAAAEQLWAALARETPDPEAAVPAALLALSALARGRGALANIALDRAERAWPAHHLTGLIRQTAAAGIRPEEIRAWLEG
ncbi:DUF4192 domain-containing protein [Pseudonocardia sp.]|uniref:DUF4192 domain-containing protein n=1 Tax=Pseudonocardia sp. TaxID=60912 RepID=UPI003D0A3CB3